MWIYWLLLAAVVLGLAGLFVVGPVGLVLVALGVLGLAAYTLRNVSRKRDVEAHAAEDPHAPGYAHSGQKHPAP